MKQPDYGRAFSLWRNAHPELWERYVRHEFVEQLRKGDLPSPAFFHYLRQDYVFLFHYSRAWALAAAKAENLHEMRSASATVHALLQLELPLHVQACAAEGITADQLAETPEAPENLAYTRYVLEAGYTGDFLDLMAALAPCVMGYGEIGMRLADCDTPYRSWVEAYASREYQATCQEVGALIDCSLELRLGATWEKAPRWSRLCRHFATATALEIGFWDMGLRGS